MLQKREVIALMVAALHGGRDALEGYGDGTAMRNDVEIAEHIWKLTEDE